MIHPVYMNRITQLVALMVALLLASQSAFADSYCAHWLRLGDTHDSTCCAAAANGPQPADCHRPMRSSSFSVECTECTCSVATSQLAAQPAASPKFKAHLGAVLVPIAQLPALAPIALPAESVRSSFASGPAKHLLGHVFRV